MTDVTAIIPLQPYEPFKTLAHRLVNDLAFQTMPVKIVTSLQKPEGVIEKGKLYDKGVDEAKTECLLFVDADMELPKEFVNDIMFGRWQYSIIYGVFEKRPNWRKTADGCWLMRKADWLKFRESKNYEKFMGIHGIPAGMGWFIEWATDNLDIGYLTDCPMKLRFPGNKARKHQAHMDRHRARQKSKEVAEQGKFIPHWELVDNEWKPRQSRPATA